MRCHSTTRWRGSTSDADRTITWPGAGTGAVMTGPQCSLVRCAWNLARPSSLPAGEKSKVKATKAKAMAAEADATSSGKRTQQWRISPEASLGTTGVILSTLRSSRPFTAPQNWIPTSSESARRTSFTEASTGSIRNGYTSERTTESSGRTQSTMARSLASTILESGLGT